MKYDIAKFGWRSKKSPHPHGIGCAKSIISRLDNFKSLVNFEVTMGLELYFGTICVVEFNLSRINIQLFLGWHVLKR